MFHLLKSFPGVDLSDPDIRFLSIGFCIVLFTSILTLLDKWKTKNEKSYTKKNFYACIFLLITVLGAYMSMSGGLNSIVKQRINDSVVKERQNKIDAQSKSIENLELINENLINKNLQYSKRLDSSSSESFRLSQEINKKAELLGDFQSGKDSYCYFKFGMRIPPNTYHYNLYAIGSNPLDNVLARVADVLHPTGNPFEAVIDIGKLYPVSTEVITFDQVYTPKSVDSIWLNIFFQTGKKRFVEELKEVRINGKWMSSIKVFDGVKKVFEKTDNTFPKSFLKLE